MPLPPVPTKTPLGQEELRHRSSGLGQRHRTILFLIDGRRTLAEVLSLALKAGAATSHFEDLVRLGYVELPAEATALPAEALPEAPAFAADGEIRHLEVEVPAEPAASDAPGLTEVEAVAEADAAVEAQAQPQAVPVSVPETEAEPEPAPAPAATLPATTSSAAVVVPAAGPSAEPHAVTLVAVPAAAPPPAPIRAPSPPRRPVTAGTTRLPPAPPPPAPTNEDRPLLERARASVLEALHHDSQPSGNRIAERARQAPTLAELVEVVWIMERGVSHSQRSHRGLLALQRARELLGLGNTLVDEESRPGRLDDDW